MAKVILANAFSLSMLKPEHVKQGVQIFIKELSIEEVKELLSQGFESAIGHESTAKILTQLLGVEVPTRRIMVTLEPEITLIVFQLMERLPEGKILTERELQQLIERGKAKFFLVKIV